MFDFFFTGTDDKRRQDIIFAAQELNVFVEMYIAEQFLEHSLAVVVFYNEPELLCGGVVKLHVEGKAVFIAAGIVYCEAAVGQRGSGGFHFTVTIAGMAVKRAYYQYRQCCCCC